MQHIKIYVLASISVLMNIQPSTKGQAWDVSGNRRNHYLLHLWLNWKSPMLLLFTSISGLKPLMKKGFWKPSWIINGLNFTNDVLPPPCAVIKPMVYKAHLISINFASKQCWLAFNVIDNVFFHFSRVVAKARKNLEFGTNLCMDIGGFIFGLCAFGYHAYD